MAIFAGLRAHFYSPTNWESKYVPGGNPQPRNGRVIGHIINHRYVPVSSPMASEDADMLSYGASALVKAVTGDLFSNLLDVFDSGRHGYLVELP